MKINTDGVLLGVLAGRPQANRILDIGTGTGVAALMLAQRFPDAMIEAVEIDGPSAKAADLNFKSSPFASRLSAHPTSFQHFFEANTAPYDLIVSNPPFFLDSLKNPDQQKNIARHTNIDFFKQLFAGAAARLGPEGRLCIVVPPGISEKLIAIAEENHLGLNKTIAIKSFEGSTAHRNILFFGFVKQEPAFESFVIYQGEKIYSGQYKSVLKDFFTIF